MNYHQQPYTLDPNVEIPDDAPLGQGHDEDDRSAMQEAQAEHKQAVEEAGEGPEVGARAPGDHAGSEGSDESEDSGGNGDVPPDGTVEDVKAWVGDDPDRAREALDAENARPTPRQTLVTHLEGVVNG